MWSLADSRILAQIIIEVMFGDLECHMTCIEEGWHMWDETRIFGDEGLIELRRPLKFPIGWELSLSTRRGDAREILAANPNPGAATTNFLDALRGHAPVACSFADAVISTNTVASTRATSLRERLHSRAL